MLAEFVVADITLANPNVAYEIGVRDEAGQNNTLLICANNHTKDIPFDFSPLRHLVYNLNADYDLTPIAVEKLSTDIIERLGKMLNGEFPQVYSNFPYYDYRGVWYLAYMVYRTGDPTNFELVFHVFTAE